MRRQAGTADDVPRAYTISPEHSIPFPHHPPTLCQSRLLLARGLRTGAGCGAGSISSSSQGHRRALLLGGYGDGGGRRHKYDYAVPPFKKLMAAVRWETCEGHASLWMRCVGPCARFLQYVA